MSENMLNGLDGSFKSTALLVASNLARFMKKENDPICTYPQAQSKSLFRTDIDLLNEYMPLNETMLDCVLMPRQLPQSSIPVPTSMPPVEWLTCETDEPIENAWMLKRLAEKDGFVVIVPLMDSTKYARSKFSYPVEFVGFVISTSTFAITLDAVCPDVQDFMRCLLSSTQLTKIVCNAQYECAQLYKAYGVPVQGFFCLKTALETMKNHLGVLDSKEVRQDAFMPNLVAYTGITLPPARVFDAWKKPCLLQFVQALLANTYFLMTFRRHLDNALSKSLYNFGFDWPRSSTYDGVVHLLPKWFGENTWTSFISSKENTSHLPYLFAAIMYCQHPSLKVPNPQLEQTSTNTLKVYTKLHNLYADTVEPYIVDSYTDESLAILQSFVNWIEFEATSACILKYHLISHILEKLLYHAPLFCAYVDRSED